MNGAGEVRGGVEATILAKETTLPFLIIDHPFGEGGRGGFVVALEGSGADGGRGPVVVRGDGMESICGGGMGARLLAWAASEPQVFQASRTRAWNSSDWK